jgi:hypothetical protein
MIVLPTDSELVEAAAATYLANAVPNFQDDDRAIKVFVTKRTSDGLNIIAIEGTHDPLGWALDFLAAEVEDQQGMNHATLGWIHAGFYSSAVVALTRCALIAAEGPYAICGHSLGAALALLIGSLLSQDQLDGRSLAPVKIGAFAPPRVGDSTFVKVATSIPLCAYRYNVDPVPQVPLTISPAFPYMPVPMTALPGPSIPLFAITRRLACHNIANYVAGVKGLAA